MQDRTATLCFGALGGAAIALAAAWALPHTEAPPRPATGGEPAASASPAATGSPTAAAPAAAVDLHPVLHRLDGIALRLRQLEAKVDELAAAPARAVAAPQPGATVLDADTVLAALEAAAARKLEAMSDPELTREARRLQKAGDFTEAERRLRALLDRPLSPEERAQAETQLGVLLRARGGDDDRAAAAELFQAVVDRHGLASDVGSRAGLQLVWTQTKGGDPNTGLAQAEALAATPGITDEIRRNARWAIGILAQQSGDARRARAEYEALLREVDSRPDQAKLAEDIRRRLTEL